MKIEILSCIFGLVVASLASPTDIILEEWKVKIFDYILKSMTEEGKVSYK